jgi:ribonuclease J
MKTRFIMHSGLYTIGGVVCSVEYGKDRVIFEMGSAYDPKFDVYDGKVLIRNKAWVRDAIRVNKIPAIHGIYRKQDLDGFMNLVPAEESELNTAIFITHLHLDHMSGIGMIAPEIPIYMHEDATRIERALEVTGEGVPTLERDYIHLEENTPVRIGAIEVLPIPTSRRSYRDFALLITTPDGTIHWTGDLSLHGKDAQLTNEMMELLKRRGIDVLLCDATSFMDEVLLQIYESNDPEVVEPSRDIPEGMLSGADVERELFRILSKQRGLCVINFYQREMDEAQRYIEWAEAAGRICVFEPDCAYVVYSFHHIKPHVHIPDSPRYPSEKEQQDEWFKELMDNCILVASSEIEQNPGGYLLQNSYRHLLELFDLPDDKGAYLHADGIPIGDFDPAYKNMLRIIGRTQFKYVTFFCKNYFGHGYPSQVKYFCDEIDPKVLIPCHSFNPERLLPNHGVQLLPELGKPYVLVDGRLVPETEIEQ